MMRAMSPENLTSAFRKTGIHPITKDMIPDSDIASSLIYNQHDVTHLSSSHPPNVSSAGLIVRMKNQKTLKMPTIQHFLPAEQSLQLYRDLKRYSSLHFCLEI